MNPLYNAGEGAHSGHELGIVMGAEKNNKIIMSRVEITGATVQQTANKEESALTHSLPVFAVCISKLSYRLNTS